MFENQFAIYDIDMDGKEELLIALTHYPMAAMRTIIYDYDSNTNKFREQFTGFNWMNFYNNGSLEVMWSHNQGSAGDSLWPYTLYRYNLLVKLVILMKSFQKILIKMEMKSSIM